MLSTTTAPQIGFKLPLVNLGTAVAALGITEEKVFEAIEEGKIAFAFDFSSRGCKRVAVRILAQALADFQNRKPAATASESEQFNQAVRLIFPAVTTKPGSLQTVRVVTIYRRLCINHDHAARLVRDDEMRLAKGAKFRRGPTGSPEVEFSSVGEFLKRRRIA